jgi:hypothetical protein
MSIQKHTRERWPSGLKRAVQTSVVALAAIAVVYVLAIAAMLFYVSAFGLHLG